jgi:hypothetical protein
MKKPFLIVIASLLFLQNYCQITITEKYDKFSSEDIKITSWAMIVDNMRTDINYAISKGTYGNRLHIRMMSTEPRNFTINEGQEFIFLLSGGDEVILPALKTDTTCAGCGCVGLFGSLYPGIDMIYQFSDGQIDKLINNSIESVQVNIVNGKIKEIVKEKKYDYFKYVLQMITK